MNWKLVVLGGLAMYVVMFLVSFATGPLIHEGVLDKTYSEHEEFWRPELREDPPNLAAMMPRWISVGVITTLIMAALYGVVHTAFSGPGWMKGLKYGAGLAILMSCFGAGWSGVFNLPDSIWAWWGAESFVYYLPGGAVLGWLGDKFQ